jgi:ADP-ribose pyrophosphatase
MSRPLVPLPDPPAIRLDVVQDRSAGSCAVGGYFDVHRLDFVAHYPDGAVSEPFSHDVGARKLLDGAIIAACFVDHGERHVFLRSAVRPPVAMRPTAPMHNGALWELPGGLIEPHEQGVDAALRELREELGFTATAEQMHLLGGWTFLAPAILAERLIYFMVDVDPRARGTPTEDGSVLERHGQILALPVVDAIEHCHRGAIQDAKTELGLRRLLEIPVPSPGRCVTQPPRG